MQFLVVFAGACEHELPRAHTSASAERDNTCQTDRPPTAHRAPAAVCEDRGIARPRLLPDSQH